MKSSRLVFDSVCFSRGEFNFSLDQHFPPALMSVVLGPSGSGKSTLLDLTAGFLKPDQGRIYEGNRDVTSLAPHRRDMGMVFQESALFNHMSVLDNVAYGPLRRGVGRQAARKKAVHFLDLVGLKQYADRRPFSLSGGERQRVALARALAPEPKLLLLDEPFNALDSTLRHRLGGELRRIQKALGVTVILVTHDQQEAMALADRLAIMKGGTVAQFASPQEIWEKPADLFTALFLGRNTCLAVQRYAKSQEHYLDVHTHAGVLRWKNAPLDPPSVPATLVIRPEYPFSVLSSDGQEQQNSPSIENLSGEWEGKLRARVLEREYRGGRWNLSLGVDDGAPGDRIEISVQGKPIAQEGEWLSLAVKDRGPLILAGAVSS